MQKNIERFGAMSIDFFESEIVQKCVEDINDLQMEVMLFAQYSEFASGSR